MPGSCASGVVHREEFLDPPIRVDLRGSKDFVAEAAYQLERIGTIARHSERRMRLLHRFGNYHQVVDLEETPVVREALVLPGTKHDVESLEETIAALALGNPEAAEMRRNRSAADAELDAPVAKHVERRNFLSNADRMRQWQENNGDSQPQSFSAFCDGREK